jgi:hypothetical protein
MCRVKPQGDGITEKRVQKARAEHKPNLNNALALDFTQHKNQCNLQRAKWVVGSKNRNLVILLLFETFANTQALQFSELKNCEHMLTMLVATVMCYSWL